MEDWNNTINQLVLVDIYRKIDKAAVEYMFFSCTHKTFTNIDHILAYKTDLNKCK